MFQGVNASDGIGIGVARVAVEPDLSFEPKAVEDTAAEQARYEAARDRFIEMTDKQIESMQARGLVAEAGIMGAQGVCRGMYRHYP